MAVSFQVTFDAGDPGGLAEFWSQVLGYVLEPPPPGYESWEDFADAVGIPQEDRDRLAAAIDPAGAGPRLLFQKVPEAKTAKNRVHLDVNVGGGRDVPADERRARVLAAAERLVERGGELVVEREDHSSHWIVMRDPEGNEFCLQ
jgi:hypothetical protein